MKDKKFRCLGQLFHEWYETDKVKFIYGADAGNLKTEIKRVSRLIRYVKKKKENIIIR